MEKQPLTRQHGSIQRSNKEAKNGHPVGLVNRLQEHDPRDSDHDSPTNVHHDVYGDSSHSRLSVQIRHEFAFGPKGKS
jgi:hypothetical protein